MAYIEQKTILLFVVSGIIFVSLFGWMNELNYITVITDPDVANQFNTKNITSSSQHILLHPIGANPFHFTCISFPAQCKTLGIYNNTLNCMSLFSTCWQIIYKQNNLSFFLPPLFALSFRREFLLNYMHSTNMHSSQLEFETNYCVNRMIKDILVQIYDSQKWSRNVIYHTHISKTAGTSIWNTFCLYNAEFYNHSFRISESQDTPRGSYMFGRQIWADSGSIDSCQWLYDKSYFRKDRAATLRRPYMEKENPLDNCKLCKQFINSIVLREPMEHRLSFLTFKLRAKYTPNAKLLCRQTKYTTHWQRSNEWFNIANVSYVGCDTIRQLDGFLAHLFAFHRYMRMDPAHIIHIEAQRFAHHLLRNISYGGKHRINVAKPIAAVIEWIGEWDKSKHGAAELTFDGSKYALFYEQERYRLHYRNASYFNVSLFQGFLNNIYVRWLGFKHPDNNINYDAVSRNDIYINEHTLNEAKRILLQYDHILLLEKENNKYLPNSSINWKFYLKEFQRISHDEYHNLNGTNEVTLQNMNYKEFSHTMDSALVKGKNSQTLIAANYRKLIERNGEIEILKKYNKLDFQLYEYAKLLVEYDTYFLKYLLPP